MAGVELAEYAIKTVFAHFLLGATFSDFYYNPAKSGRVETTV